VRAVKEIATGCAKRPKKIVAGRTLTRTFEQCGQQALQPGRIDWERKNGKRMGGAVPQPLRPRSCVSLELATRRQTIRQRRCGRCEPRERGAKRSSSARV